MRVVRALEPPQVIQSQACSSTTALVGARRSLACGSFEALEALACAQPAVTVPCVRTFHLVKASRKDNRGLSKVSALNVSSWIMRITSGDLVHTACPFDNNKQHLRLCAPGRRNMPCPPRLVRSGRSAASSLDCNRSPQNMNICFERSSRAHCTNSGNRRLPPPTGEETKSPIRIMLATPCRQRGFGASPFAKCVPFQIFRIFYPIASSDYAAPVPAPASPVAHQRSQRQAAGLLTLPGCRSQGKISELLAERR